MAETLRWGILGLGGIAHTFAKGLADSQTGQLVAVGSRSQENADQFGAQYNVAARYPTYDALLADPQVQAVYIATPHPMHVDWAIRAANAGKHVLCEKPITLNYAEAMSVIEAARRNQVFLMEAFMYRCHPQTRKLAELVRDGAIGEVRVIHTTFSFNGGFHPEGRLLNPALGGGGILDVGCYCASMTRLLAGSAMGQPFADPTDVQAVGRIGDVTHVDEWTVANLKFDNDIVAQLSTGVLVNQESVVRVYGSEGSIFIPSPWFCGADEDGTRLVLQRNGQPTERITVETDRSLYAYEADAFAEGVATGAAPWPAMSPADSLGNMKTLDRWRNALGLTYPAEAPEGQTSARGGQPLAARPGHAMTYSKIGGIALPVSRMVMGTMLEGALMRAPQASTLFDDFMERGGNCFDTAHVYGSEAIVGNWVARRGVREKIVLIAKGAHTPFCTPEGILRQLDESLGRLRTDYADLYLMHRDNLDVPVGDFVETLNALLKAGRVRTFGGSNWTLERVQAANDYAESKGLVGFAAVSNNFSLARMVNPVWGGCVASSDAESRDWFTRTQTPLFSWSSQARGFFVRGDPNDTRDEELALGWYSADNFERLARVREMAKQKGVQPITLAAAYVLNQPFPTYALIGPRSPDEMRSSMEALEMTLTPEELRHLNLE